jgi:uncharacterized protein (TIGR00251 family)
VSKAPSARIKIHVQPRAARNEITGMHGDSLRIRLAAPPVDNAANEALVAFVAETLGVPKRQIRIAAGATSRKKQIEIDGITAEQALNLMLLKARKPD